MRTLLTVLITAVLTAVGVAIAQPRPGIEPLQPLPPDTTTVRHVKGNFDCRAVVTVHQDKKVRVKRLSCRLER